MEKSILNLYDEFGETAQRLILAELRTGPKCVGDLVKTTGLKQPNVSNHLARLKAKKIVRFHKDGRHVYYSLANPEIEAAVKTVFNLSVREPGEVHIHNLAVPYAEAAILGNEVLCTQYIQEAFRAESPLIDIYSDVFEPAMSLVGQWYVEGRTTVSEEHLASAITERLMAKTANMFPRRPSLDKYAVLGCAAQSWHSLGLRMVADLMTMRGWTCFFLGANVPTKSFIETVKNISPTMVLVSCAAEESELQTRELLSSLNALRSENMKFFIALGGAWVSYAPDKFSNLGVDIFAKNLRDLNATYLPALEGTAQN